MVVTSGMSDSEPEQPDSAANNEPAVQKNQYNLDEFSDNEKVCLLSIFTL